MTQRLRAIRTRTYSVDGCPCLTSLESEGELQVGEGASLASGGKRREEEYKRVPFLQHLGGPTAIRKMWRPQDAGSKPTHHALTGCIK